MRYNCCSVALDRAFSTVAAPAASEAVAACHSRSERPPPAAVGTEPGRAVSADPAGVTHAERACGASRDANQLHAAAVSLVVGALLSPLPVVPTRVFFVNDIVLCPVVDNDRL
jgi:hypothetical protein